MKAEKKVIKGWILPADLNRWECHISEIIPVFQRKLTEDALMLPVELIIYAKEKSEINETQEEEEERRLENLLPWAND